MAFTRTELNSFRTDFASAVAKLEKQYKVEIGIGNISYTELTGFKPRSPKFPIVATKIGTDQSYKLPKRAIATL